MSSQLCKMYCSSHLYYCSYHIMSHVKLLSNRLPRTKRPAVDRPELVEVTFLYSYIFVPLSSPLPLLCCSILGVSIQSGYPLFITLSHELSIRSQETVSAACDGVHETFLEDVTPSPGQSPRNPRPSIRDRYFDHWWWLCWCFGCIPSFP